MPGLPQSNYPRRILYLICVFCYVIIEDAMRVYTKKIEHMMREKRHKERTIKDYLSHRLRQMKYRCNNPNSPIYKYYGGRGIQCKFKSTNSFILWVTGIMGYDTIEKLRGLEIDRIDNNGHYECGNIRFVTRAENNRNKRNTKKKSLTYCPHCGMILT